MTDHFRPDPRFVEQLWAQVELEAFGPQRVVVAARDRDRRPHVLLAAAAAVTVLAMLAVSSLQRPQAIDRLDLDRAVPPPSPRPIEAPELRPDVTAERVDAPAPVGPPLAQSQPGPAGAPLLSPVAVPALALPTTTGAGLRPPGPAARPPVQAPSREQRIVFSSRRSGNGEIYTMRLDGTDVQQVSESGGRLFNKAGDWSPDGRWIAYGSAGNGLVVVRADGEEVRVVAKNRCTQPDPNACPGDHTPSWSPDGQWLVFGRGYDEAAECSTPDAGALCASLWVVRRDGRDLRPLGTTGREPHWSPDGQRIVFVDGRGSTSAACTYTARNCPGALFTIRPDGTDRRALGLVGDYPRWSPDSRSILYGSEPVGAPHDLYVADADGSDVRRVTDGPGVSGGGDWSPDGTSIVYHYMPGSEATDDEFEIYLRRLDGTGGARRLTTRRGYDILPRFSPL